MCNDYRLEVDIASIAEDFENLKIKISMPEGVPNVPAREDINITDMGPIVRNVEGSAGVGELLNRRWSWPARTNKPVYNFVADNREFNSHRCLILADGFYEFTDPEAGQKRKSKWLFTMPGHRWFCIAGIWHAHPDIGEAFTMLTIEPGEDIKPFHHRQIVPLEQDRWADWLNPEIPAKKILQPLPKGRLQVTKVFPTALAQGALF